jgi:hypothetical protein
MTEDSTNRFAALLLQPTLRALRVIPGFATAERAPRSWLQRRDLRRLNDVLARTPLAGRYQLFGGVLLGWAREGRPLPHDFRDADFAYDAADDDRFAAAIPELQRAGFRRLFRFRSNDGEFSEHTFLRRGAKFEFFRFTRRDNHYRYHVFASDPEDEGRFIEMIGEIPAQPLEPVEFLGRTWLKPADHEAELEAIYGDWRTPDPEWSFLDDRAIVERRPWKYPDYQWDG